MALIVLLLRQYHDPPREEADIILNVHSQQAERAVGIGKLCKAPTGILARATHMYSKALSMAGDGQESERQRQEAQRLRMTLPAGSTDLDDESDEAYEMIVKMDQR